MLWGKVQGAGGAGGSLPVEIVGTRVTVLSQGTSITSVAHLPEDFIVFVDGNNGGSSNVAPPALTSGYTNIVAHGNTTRPVRVQYKVATSSGTETVTSDDYGFLFVIRNAVSIGASGLITSNSSFTAGNAVNLPGLSGLNTTNSLILGGSYFPGATTSGDLSTVTSPYVLGTAVNNNSVTLNSYVAVLNNTNSTQTSKSFTSKSTLAASTWAVEIIGA